MNFKQASICILLAEDSPTDYHLVVETLKETHLCASVKWVKDGEEVMDYLFNRGAFADRSAYPKPDLIFLDVKMPRKGGREAFEEIVNHVDLRGIPVIFLTHIIDQEIAVNLMKSGASDYLSKIHLSPDVLERSVRYAMEIHKKEKQRLRAEHLAVRLGRVLDHSSNEIYMFAADTHVVLQVNRGIRRHLGYTAEELLHMRPIDFMPKISEHRFAELIKPLLVGSLSHISFETVQQRKNGSHYPVKVKYELSRLERPPVFVAIVEDATEQKQAQEAIAHMHFYDKNTELPNRLLFKDRVTQALKVAERTALAPVLMCVDLDHFKGVIETLGHEMADRILKSTADRLKDVVREGDTVARMDGDEFMLLLPGSGAKNDIGKIAQRVLNVFVRPFNVDGNEVHLTASIGVSVYPSDGKTAESLIKSADTAMYRAKEHGRNNYEFYSPQMHAKAFGKMTLENSLRRALDYEQLVLYYQPQLDMRTNRVLGVEALVRWLHPEMGLVHPSNFIPLAEETGLIHPLGEWVLAEACHQCRVWEKESLNPVTVSVNISAQQIQRLDFVEAVDRVLAHAGLAAGRLVLEVTENIFVDHSGQALDTLNRLKQMGVKIAIDDFGTGYCSLGYLKTFNVDMLKIDQSFIRQMTRDVDYFAIVKSIIDLGHSLRLQVVGEGVESPVQLDLLRKENCDRVQGFLFAKPLPPGEIAAAFLGKSYLYSPGAGSPATTD